MANILAPLFAGVPGGMEMVVILLIAVLLFGANKIPKLARSTGQAMGEFQKGRQEVEQELEEMEEAVDPNADLSGDQERNSEAQLDEELAEEDEDFDIEPDES